MRKKTFKKLSIYLIKEGLKALEDITDFSKIKSASAFKATDLGQMYFGPSEQSQPEWLRLLSSELVTPPELFNQSTSAAWLVEAAGRYFVLTFGYGRHLIRQSAFVEDFGLKVVLNVIEADKIRGIDRDKIETALTTARIQRSAAGSVADFGLDVEQDLVRAVIGQPEDPDLGTRLGGRDSLQVFGKLNLGHIRDRLQTFLEEYQADKYRERGFAWIDKLSEVRDIELRESLERKVVEMLKKYDPDQSTILWMSAPEPIDWEHHEGFRFTRQGETVEDLHVEAFLTSLRRGPQSITIDNLRARKVYLISSSTEQISKTWAAYRCLHCEITEGDETFILSSGHWYKVALDFASQVREAVAAIPQSSSLPPYDHDSEQDYNRDVSERLGAHLMDRRNIRYGGAQNQVEFCDLYTKSKQLIHVKRYAGSSTLSHLFKQGLVSAQLVAAEPKFRKLLDEKLPPEFQLGTARPRTEDFEIIFGIVSRSQKPLILPFFSCVTLRSTVSTLRGLGYRVALEKIPNLRPYSC